MPDHSTGGALLQQIQSVLERFLENTAIIYDTPWQKEGEPIESNSLHVPTVQKNSSDSTTIPENSFQRKVIDCSK